MQKILPILISCCTLAACGGGNSHTTPNIMPTPENDMRVEDYQKLTKAEIEPSILKYATDTELLNHVKNGLRLRVTIFEDEATEVFPVRDFTQTDDGVTFAVVDVDFNVNTTDSFSVNATAGASTFAASSDSSSEGAPTANGFSETNTHVNGVDEADYVKYDGQYLFMSTNTTSEYGSPSTSSIRIGVFQARCHQSLI